MQIQTFVLGQLNTNCYLLSCPQTGQAVIVDPADEGDLISQELLKDHLTLQSIILTHGHFDHVLGLLELKLNFKAPIVIHLQDQFLLKNTQASALHWLKLSVDPVPLADQFMVDGQIIRFGQQSLQVIHTPGHTPGSVCLYSAADRLCLTGDTLFKNAIGRTDLSYSQPSEMERSLQKLAQLPPATTIYPGHGEISTIGDELISRQNS